MELKKINDHVSVSGQIDPADMGAIKDAGFVAIVNNRPDAEAPDQPAGDSIAAAAKVAGLKYYAIPIGREGVSSEMIVSAQSLLEENEGPVLMFCRSGTRSTTLWALSQAGQIDPSDIISAALKAGYDMSHLADHLGKTNA